LQVNARQCNSRNSWKDDLTPHPPDRRKASGLRMSLPYGSLGLAGWPGTAVRVAGCETGGGGVASKPSEVKQEQGVRHRGATRSPGRLRNAVLPLDAEDIAMARLQAHLRNSETIQLPTRSRAAALSRTWVRLPEAMLRRVRDRARHSGLSLSDIVEAALTRYLKAP
jgi:ribbon-helix-helix CopG family protein